MSFTTLTVPNEYGFVVLAAASTWITNILHSLNTGKYRKAGPYPYPITYATNEEATKDIKAYRFNCAQRAHANYTESLTPVVTALLLAGLKYPVAAAVMGLGWSVSRYVYMVGYSTGDIKSKGSGRYYGLGHILCQFGLFGTAITVGVKLAMGTL